MYKKSFSLLITLFIITLFSSLSIFIVELSNISSNIDSKNLLFTQAKLHMNSTVNTLSQIDIYDETKECIDRLNVSDDFFDIELHFSYITKRSDCTEILSNDFDSNTTKGMAIIDIYVSPKENRFGINLHKRVVKKLE